MIYLGLAILTLHFIPAAFSAMGMDIIFTWLFEVQFLLACIMLYLQCGHRNWRLKILLFASLVCAVGFFIHNTIVLSVAENSSIFQGMGIYTTFAVLAAVVALMSTPMIKGWDKLPSDEIIPGNYYEIIGQPRSDLQFLLFMLTLGEGGSYAITDGTSMIKMSKEHSQSILSKLDENYLIGKKCIHIGADTTHNKKLFLDKIGIDFSLLKSCYWLSRGFKNV